MPARERPFVSVIIPVHNADRYLDRCVESVIGQTYTDLEILLIENGSSDRSLEKSEEWAGRDARIRAIQLDQADLSLARNTGMELSHGDWIAFVDADDTLHPDMIGEMVAAGQKETGKAKTGIVDCDWRIIPGKRRSRRKDTAFYTGTEYARILMRGHDSEFAVWNKLFRRELIPWLHFAEGHVYESKVPMIRTALHSGIACMIPGMLYEHHGHEESITSSFVRNNEEDRILSAKQLVEMVGETAPSLLPDARSLAVKLYTLSWIRLQFCEQKGSTEEYLRYIRRHLSDITYGTLPERMAVYMTACLPWASRFLYMGYMKYFFLRIRIRSELMRRKTIRNNGTE